MFTYSSKLLQVTHKNHKTALGKQVDTYLGELVYGGIDGIVTTFAVVTASVSAQLSPSIIILLGFANLLADGFAMSIGSFLSARSELQKKQHNAATQDTSLKRKQLESRLRNQGLQGKNLQMALDAMMEMPEFSEDKTSNNHQEVEKPPLMIGFATYISFISLGFIPFMTYVFNFVLNIPQEFLFGVSCALTSIAFILVGWLKSRVTQYSPWRSIGETLLLGGIAAAVAYGVGIISHNVF